MMFIDLFLNFRQFSPENLEKSLLIVEYSGLLDYEYLPLKFELL